MPPMSNRATTFITTTAAIGIFVLAHSLWYWHSDDLTRFICYLIIATLASGLKIQLPGIDGTMSVNFLFILLGVLEMSLPETLVVGCTASLAQCLWSARSSASCSNRKVCASGASGWTCKTLSIGSGKPAANLPLPRIGGKIGGYRESSTRDSVFR